MWSLWPFPWFEETDTESSNECTNFGDGKCDKQCPHPRYTLFLWYNWYKWFITLLFEGGNEMKLNKAERKKFVQSNTYIYGNVLTKSLLQYGNFLSWRNCAVINKTQPFEITPPPSTMTNVNKYANTFKIRTDKSRHAWFAIEPLSILSGGSRNTSHPLVSCTVRWLKCKQRMEKKR